jgi:hypothetical protein
MNLVLHTFKNGSAFRLGSIKNPITAYEATKKYFNMARPIVLNHANLERRNGVIFEHLFHVAIVTASQRNGFGGSTLSAFILCFVQEIMIDGKDIALSKNAADFFAILPTAQIPFYPSIDAGDAGQWSSTSQSSASTAASPGPPSAG